ncbi:AT DNA binding protein [Drepanopeziza brunnea f. sp. 'multigermtubi' MB_m1]|uniref:Thymocyte nuclear protein 1 n=1 Tax=Marssonina brunnea f. sp. multigermtubi (strain MB_m1) TaxID=1072389 RepID=K1XD57_MARBU|nr:AT DNA binding protein [Drepanopeziza brunnea f. sp. 'multigermtubi' MB_m1]EKD18748.1 AT DNA binding protein [Drepanopeziza brunnea f. sp. 'multigermtubi' MB_m1]
MPPKRKAEHLGAGEQVEEQRPRRSSRRALTREARAVEQQPSQPASGSGSASASASASAKKKARPPKKNVGVQAEEDEGGNEEGGKEDDEKEDDEKEDGEKKDGEKNDDAEKEAPSTTAKTSKAARKPETADPSPPSGRQYWLLKAEPESRMEKGKDIKFSIDDLAAKTEPEPWDARNNLRAMKKGDLAFFYHSSCKVPAIVGTMEIVAEHSPDLTAHDPSAPYYDASSQPSDPKWSVVHVAFRQKLTTPITLKELRAWHAEPGGALANMQMLKLARMSVSKVSEAEWEFLVGEMRKRGDVVI